MALFNKKTDLQNAEANGQIKTMPKADTQPQITIFEKTPAIDSPEDFRNAIGHAQMEGIGYVEVTDRLFNYLVKNQVTRYLTYGDPGIKVYKDGTKDQYDKEDSMNAEAYAEMLAKRTSEGTQ